MTQEEFVWNFLYKDSRSTDKLATFHCIQGDSPLRINQGFTEEDAIAEYERQYKN